MVHQDTPETNLNCPSDASKSAETLSQLFDELSDWNHVLQDSQIGKILNNPEP